MRNLKLSLDYTFESLSFPQKNQAFKTQKAASTRRLFANISDVNQFETDFLIAIN